MRLSPIDRSILALTLPSIAANVTVPLLGLVDTAIVGHLGGASYLAAIAVGSSVFNMLYWTFGFLRAGTSGITAQAVGMGDSDTRDLTLLRGLAFAAIVGALMVALGNQVVKAMLRFMEVDQATAALARTYVLIAIWGAPAVLANYCLAGWFIGNGNTKAPMAVSISINVANIAASLALVYIARLGVAGLAIGTMSAQWLGALLGLALCSRYRPKTFPLSRLLDPAGIRRLFAVNIDIMARTLCIIAVTLWFTRKGAALGEVTLAVNALIMQLFLLTSYIMDGFAYAAEAIVGREVGARRPQRLREAVTHLMRWGLAAATIFTIAYTLGSHWFMQLMSSDTAVVSASASYRWWAVTLPLAGAGAFIYDGVFIGATRTRQMLWAMLAAMALFFILCRLLTPALGNHGLWIAFTAYLLARGTIQHLLWHPGDK